MSDYDRLAGLELRIDALELERRELDLGVFKRVTTTVVVTRLNRPASNSRRSNSSRPMSNSSCASCS